MKKLIFAMMIFVGFGAFTVSASAQLVTNGSFEDPTVGTLQNWDTYLGPVSGWNVEWMPGSGGGNDPMLELHRGVLGPAQNGQQYAELDTDWDGPTGIPGNEASSVRISQDVTTESRCTYTLNFWFSPRPNTPESDNVLGIVWEGVDVAQVSAVGGGSNNWTQYTYDVVASGNTSILAFEDRGTANSLGTFLDNVSLEQKECPPPPHPRDCGCGDVKVKNYNFSFVSNRVSSKADTGDNYAGGADGGNGGNSGAINGNDVEDSSTGNGGNGGNAGAGSGGHVQTGNAYSRAKAVNVVNTNSTRIRTRAPQVLPF